MDIPTKNSVMEQAVWLWTKAKELNACHASVTYHESPELGGWSFRLSVAAPGIFEEDED